MAPEPRQAALDYAAACRALESYRGLASGCTALWTDPREPQGWRPDVRALGRWVKADTVYQRELLGRKQRARRGLLAALDAEGGPIEADGWVYGRDWATGQVTCRRPQEAG
jgi:hypothetical protein